MKSILDILIKQGLFETLYPKSYLIKVISSYSAVLYVKECCDCNKTNYFYLHFDA